MMKKQHYITRDERQQLEALLKAKIPVSQIARQLGFCRQTIYNEIKRGQSTPVPGGMSCATPTSPSGYFTV